MEIRLLKKAIKLKNYILKLEITTRDNYYKEDPGQDK